MVLVRYNPWQDLNSVQRQLNKILDSSWESENRNNMSNVSRIPAAELIEKEDALHLKIEVPGMKAEDLDIQVMIDRVAIAGERKPLDNNDEGKTQTEFRYGKFQRVIPLPVKIQNTNVSAQYKDGILNLTLPKSEAEKNKVVKVSLNEVQ